jgi:Flp pilus assembly protein TadD
MRDELLRKAEEAYLTSLELEPNQPSVCMNLIMIYESTGRTEDAERMRQRAAKLNADQ